MFTPKQVHAITGFNLTTLRKASLMSLPLKLDADDFEGAHRRYTFADVVRFTILEHMMYRLQAPMSVAVPAVNALNSMISKAAAGYPTSDDLDSAPAGPLAVFDELRETHSAAHLTTFETFADLADALPFKAGVVLNIGQMVYFAFVASGNARAELHRD